MIPIFEPSYRELLRSGELRRRVEMLEEMLAACNICPWECGVDRRPGASSSCCPAAPSGPKGVCRSGYNPIVAAHVPHFGEEPALVGVGGVGNIFFGNCNLRCVYCQNYQISQEGSGDEVSIDDLAGMMLELQEKGCEAVGLVTPAHFVPQIVRALTIAAERGFRLPLVYNTNAYDSPGVLRLLEGIVDIYLPDLKYSQDTAGLRYSRVGNYPRQAREAIREMHRQVGSTLWLDDDGAARRGLIIRHLVLPGGLAGSRDSLQWLRDELGTKVTISLLAQYYPAHRAAEFPPLDRPLTSAEYQEVLELMEELGFENGWVQDLESRDCYRPDFVRRDKPFEVGGTDGFRAPDVVCRAGRGSVGM